MKSTCVFQHLAPGGVDCSGNGICVNVTEWDGFTCVCDEDWSGLGDFALLSQDCVSRSILVC